MSAPASRRAVATGSAAALATVATTAAAAPPTGVVQPHPDAQLLALCVRFHRQHAAVSPLAAPAPTPTRSTRR
jgi:hypothetical protein